MINKAGIELKQATLSHINNIKTETEKKLVDIQKIALLFFFFFFF
jgi:hypothetical protein